MTHSSSDLVQLCIIPRYATEVTLVPIDVHRPGNQKAFFGNNSRVQRFPQNIAVEALVMALWHHYVAKKKYAIYTAYNSNNF